MPWGARHLVNEDLHTGIIYELSSLLLLSQPSHPPVEMQHAALAPTLSSTWQVTEMLLEAINLCSLLDFV